VWLKNTQDLEKIAQKEMKNTQNKKYSGHNSLATDQHMRLL
jgi:hypothetical protein